MNFPSSRSPLRVCAGLVFVLLAGIHLPSGAAEPALRARYMVLTARNRATPPFAAVDWVQGGMERVGRKEFHWWQLEVRANPDQQSTPLVTVRGLTDVNPLPGRATNIAFARYLVSIPETGETLDFVDCHSGQALLPVWGEFTRHFLPHRSEAAHDRQGVPETAEFLGHVLTLHHVGTDESWAPWPDAKRLALDREMLVGTGRNFRDAEGRRLPQQPELQNYTYVPFTEQEYRVMFEAGMNLFTVKPDQEAFVRAESVFYLRAAGGKPALRYPADLYRANYLGSVMFMDEPSILMVGDTNIHRTLRYFSDASALIEKRTRTTWLSSGSYGAFALEKALTDRGVNFGDMRLMQADYPSWETLYDTAFYQMKGGGAGIVHEGRYQLGAFDAAVERFTGKSRAHTAGELLRYHYAFLRGGTRPFDKFWGTAIYGQCDPAIAPEALTLAYDLGARYFWFWTSDHDHHVPWPEQLELARTLKRHASTHPRESIFQSPPRRDVAIVIPNGYFLSLENLWWVRVMDKEGRNEASLRYRRVMQRALAAVHECFARGKDFDITVDDGRPIRGYRRIVRVDDRGDD